MTDKEKEGIEREQLREFERGREQGKDRERQRGNGDGDRKLKTESEKMGDAFSPICLYVQ